MAGHRPDENRTFERLLADLTAEDASVRSAAAEALSKRHDSRAVEPLIEALRRPDLQLRMIVARALDKVGDERAIPALTEWYEDAVKRPQLGSSHVYLEAMAAIRKRHGERAEGNHVRPEESTS